MSNEPSSATYENPPLAKLPVKNPQVIKDMDQLVLLFAMWHKLGNQKCQNMFDMPEGHAVELVLKEDEPPIEMVLEGEKYQAFRMGIMAAVECFGPLPFTYSIDEAAEAPQEQADGTAPGE